MPPSAPPSRASRPQPRSEPRRHADSGADLEAESAPGAIPGTAGMGLVSRVVAPEMRLESALEVARAIAENSEYGVWMRSEERRVGKECLP